MTNYVTGKHAQATTKANVTHSNNMGQMTFPGGQQMTQQQIDSANQQAQKLRAQYQAHSQLNQNTPVKLINSVNNKFALSKMYVSNQTTSLGMNQQQVNNHSKKIPTQKQNANQAQGNSMLLRQLMGMSQPANFHPRPDKNSRTVRSKNVPSQLDNFSKEVSQTGGDIYVVDHKKAKSQRKNTNGAANNNHMSTQPNFYQQANFGSAMARNLPLDDKGNSGSVLSGISGIIQVNQKKSNLRSSYNTNVSNTNKNTFYPDINLPITSEGRRNIPQNGSYFESQGNNTAISGNNNSSRMQFKKF